MKSRHIKKYVIIELDKNEDETNRVYYPTLKKLKIGIKKYIDLKSTSFDVILIKHCRDFHEPPGKQIWFYNVTDDSVDRYDYTKYNEFYKKDCVRVQRVLTDIMVRYGTIEK